MAKDVETVEALLEEIATLPDVDESKNKDGRNNWKVRKVTDISGSKITGSGREESTLIRVYAADIRPGHQTFFWRLRGKDPDHDNNVHVGIIRRGRAVVLEHIDRRYNLLSGPASQVEGLPSWDGESSFYLNRGGPNTDRHDQYSLENSGLLPATERAIQHVAELAEGAYQLYRRELPELPASFN